MVVSDVRKRNEEDGKHKCIACGGYYEEPYIIFESDPYADEIHGDNTPVWECRACRYQSCADI